MLGLALIHKALALPGGIGTASQSPIRERESRRGDA